METRSYTLKRPVEAEGGPVTEVVLREPDVDALEAIDDLHIVQGERMSVRQLRGIIRALSGLPDPVIGRIHKDDFAALVEVAVPLLEGPEEQAA